MSHEKYNCDIPETETQEEGFKSSRGEEKKEEKIF